MSNLNDILFLFDNGIYYIKSKNSLEPNSIKKEKSYNIHVDCSSFTLIPEQIFKNINPSEIHSFLGKEDNEYSFQECFLPKENAYLIWAINNNQLQKIENQFPASKLSHFSSLLLNDNHYKNEIRFFKKDSFMYISAIKNHKLQLVNRFEVEGLDDVLYYILSIIKESDLINQSFDIIEIGTSDREIESRLKSIFRREITKFYHHKPLKLNPI